MAFAAEDFFRASDFLICGSSPFQRWLSRSNSSRTAATTCAGAGGRGTVISNVTSRVRAGIARLADERRRDVDPLARFDMLGERAAGFRR
jgi:hypothetical protein